MFSSLFPNVAQRCRCDIEYFLIETKPHWKRCMLTRQCRASVDANFVSLLIIANEFHVSEEYEDENQYRKKI